MAKKVIQNQKIIFFNKFNGHFQLLFVKFNTLIL